MSTRSRLNALLGPDKYVDLRAEVARAGEVPNHKLEEIITALEDGKTDEAKRLIQRLHMYRRR
ncbi:hypothetical protein ACFXNW_09040 [Nocardia sp. NPDC059180]|uniref:hypothetical protein n=1 Tax=Nocardia sp. NPDC059180 TaxID=3346761 RepID=UPI0036CCCCBE